MSPARRRLRTISTKIIQPQRSVVFQPRPWAGKPGTRNWSARRCGVSAIRSPRRTCGRARRGGDRPTSDCRDRSCPWFAACRRRSRSGHRNHRAHWPVGICVRWKPGLADLLWPGWKCAGMDLHRRRNRLPICRHCQSRPERLRHQRHSDFHLRRAIGAGKSPRPRKSSASTEDPGVEAAAPRQARPV